MSKQQVSFKLSRWALKVLEGRQAEDDVDRTKALESILKDYAGSIAPKKAKKQKRLTIKQKKEMVLKAVESCRHWRTAANRMGIPWRTVRDWLKKDKAFAEELNHRQRLWLESVELDMFTGEQSKGESFASTVALNAYSEDHGEKKKSSVLKAAAAIIKITQMVIEKFITGVQKEQAIEFVAKEIKKALSDYF